MSYLKYLIAATLFVVQLQSLAGDKQEVTARSETHGRTRGRVVNPARREWTFDRCQRWHHETNCAEPFTFTVSAQEKPKTWASYETLTGEMQASGEEKLTFEFPLSDLEKGFADYEQNYVGASVGYKGETYHSVNASYHRNPKTKEKVFSIITEEPYRQTKPSVNRFKVLTMSNTGELVEAQLTYTQGELYAINVIKTCGNGFGIPNDGKPITFEGNPSQTNAEIGEFPTHMYGTQSVRRRLHSQQMKVIAYHLQQQFKANSRYDQTTDTQLANKR